jgi:hypothetical protein
MKVKKLFVAKMALFSDNDNSYAMLQRNFNCVFLYYIQQQGRKKLNTDDSLFFHIYEISCNLVAHILKLGVIFKTNHVKI